MRVFPINIVIKEKPCIVIGGGEVAARKIKGLLEAGAYVTVVSPEVCAEIEGLENDGRIKLVRREYQFGDLDGMYLAIAATDDPELNSLVAEDARSEKVPVNVADTPQLCDFMLPAVVRRGEVTVAVGTSGASPALARNIREKIEKTIGPEYGRLARVLGLLRAGFIEKGDKLSQKRQVFESLIDSDLLDCLKRKDYRAAEKIIEGVIGEPIKIDMENEL